MAALADRLGRGKIPAKTGLSPKQAAGFAGQATPGDAGVLGDACGGVAVVGLHLRDYSSALRLSSYSLKRWRDLIETEEVVIDWRALLHPSARPPISTKICTRTKEAEGIEALTAAIEAEAGPPKRATRRRWATEEKIALLLEVERHGETVSSIGRRHGISTSVLFRWRDQFGLGHEKPMTLATVQVVEGRAKPGTREASLLAGLLPCPDGMKEVELADGQRVFVPIEACLMAVERAVAEREMRS